MLGIVDDPTMRLIVNAPTGRDATSVAVDPKTQNLFVPVAPTATFGGGINVYRP